MQRRITLLLLCWAPLCLFAQPKDHLHHQIQKILYYDLDHDYDQTPGFLTNDYEPFLASLSIHARED